MVVRSAGEGKVDWRGGKENHLRERRGLKVKTILRRREKSEPAGERLVSTNNLLTIRISLSGR